MLEAVEVDRDRRHGARGADGPLARRRLRCRRRLGRRFRRRRGHLDRRPEAARRSAGRHTLFIALRQERRRIALAQHRGVEAERLGVIVVRHVEPLRPESEVGRREEPQILAARVPRRRHRVSQSVGHLLRRARLDVHDLDRLVERVEMLRVGDPLAVRRPRRIHRARRHHPRIVADDLRLPRRDVHDPQVQVRVVEQDALAVGRPRRRIEVARRRNLDLARRRQAVLRLDVQLVLARLVAEVRELLAVRRPRRLALRRRRSSS